MRVYASGVEKRLARPSSISALQLLDRILGQSALTQALRELPGPALAKLVDHVGLEDSGELLALASTEQLQQVMDHDLWRAQQPGQDETFRADRVAIWLTLMVDAGDAFVAAKLAELPEEIVMLALHRSILVVDIDQLGLEMSGRQRDVDLLEKALESCLYHEFEEYRVIARRDEGWDAVLSALLALDQHDHALLQRILSRCCHASMEVIEESGGLYEVLSSGEMLESDAAADRQDRRARKGYVSPADARAFLALAQQTPLSKIVAATTRDPITAAYFRELELPRRPAGGASKASRRGKGASATSTAQAERGTVAQLVGLLKQAGLYEGQQSRALLPAGPGDGAPRGATLIQQALAQLAQRDIEAHGQRVEELTYLANVVVAGCGQQGKPFPLDGAVDATLAICTLGLELVLAQQPSAKQAGPREDAAMRVLQREGADKLFRLGWHLMHRDGPRGQVRDWHDVPLIAKPAIERALTRARKFF